jgi:glyoxylase I family protein
MPEYLRIHHASIVVADLERALRFYCDVLGLPLAAHRPDLGFAGAWLAVGEQQIHLLVVPNPDPVAGRPAHVGRDRHTAVHLRGLESLVAALDAAGIAYTRSRSGRSAVFVRDPDGNGIELIGVDG